MDSFELNKVAGAALSAMLVIFGGKALLDLVHSKHKAEKPAFTLPASAPAALAGGGDVAFDFKKFAPLLAKGNVEAGADVFKKCAACHTPEKGGAAKVGPNLWGVIGRPVASGAGFAYSDAMKGHGGAWSWDRLATYVNEPRGTVPGNKMAFAGIKDDADLADVLAYLRTLADSPAPLPQ